MATYSDGKQINIDPHDWKGMKELTKKHEEFPYACFGVNEDGEQVLISVNKDNITTETFQSNGWVRENIYHVNDYTVEELFHGPSHVRERYLSNKGE